jgi:hypothetical protein
MQMHAGNVMKVYEIGRRGKPVRTIMPGDLDDPYGKSPWQRVVTLWSALVDIARESRALETEMLGRAAYRDLGRS